MSGFRQVLLIGVMGVVMGGVAPLGSNAAEPLEMVRRGAVLAPVHDTGDRAAGQSGTASLFVGRQTDGLLAPRAASFSAHVTAHRARLVRDLIAKAEAGRHGYDAVQLGARKKPRTKPTEMTLAEIFEWIADTPGQPHAIGRYQFIPATLRRLVTAANLPPGTRFSPQVQDRLADILLSEAGIAQANMSDVARHRFMRNLAKTWAGFPLPSGKSYYHGISGNKATMSWSKFGAEMAQIFRPVSPLPAS